MPITIAEDAKALIDENTPPAPGAQEAFEMLHDQVVGKGELAAALLRQVPGVKFVYNRLPVAFEKFFDGMPYKWQPNETLPMPTHIADFMYSQSCVSYEPVTGQTVRALVTPDDDHYGIPYTADLGPELLSREVSDNYTQRGTGGLPTSAKIIAVKGGGYDQGRPIGARSRLL